MLDYLFDKNLTLNEKGMLALLLNLPKDFEIKIKNLYAISSSSKYMTKVTLQRLKKKGYLKTEHIKPFAVNFQYRYEIFTHPQRDSAK